MSDQPLTTAGALVAFRNELIQGGFNEHDATQIAHSALKEIVTHDGLHVRVEVSA